MPFASGAGDDKEGISKACLPPETKEQPCSLRVPQPMCIVSPGDTNTAMRDIPGQGLKQEGDKIPQIPGDVAEGRTRPHAQLCCAEPLPSAGARAKALSSLCMETDSS